MKMSLLLGSSILALGVGSASAGATPFTYTGASVSYIVPTTGSYEIDAYGAQGGAAGNGILGGFGAFVSGNFSLTAGETLFVAVGGQGGQGTNDNGSYGGGGGGGSFVVVSATGTPLLIAGGGGGAYSAVGGAGQATLGGTGQGGTGNQAQGGGGAGFFSAGGGASQQGGFPYPSLAAGGTTFTGGANGGFGGGGGSGGYGAAGGGGYNGGNGSSNGTGGTSFDSGTNQVLNSGNRSGNGEVDITLLSASTPVPEPASGALLAAGIGGLGATRRRKHKA